MGLREKYESHHKCRYTSEAIDAAVHLSARYIPDRYLPDKAIDLIDEAGSRARMEAHKRRKEEQTSILSKSPSDYWQEIRAVQNMHELVMALFYADSTEFLWNLSNSLSLMALILSLYLQVLASSFKEKDDTSKREEDSRFTLGPSLPSIPTDNEYDFALYSIVTR